MEDIWRIAVNVALKSSPPLIAFVGTSGSGKTTVMEYVTANLTRLGFRVGVAKHIHTKGLTIDTEGKDTWRHARAGARVVIAVSPNELAVIKKTSSETEFEQIIREFDSLDLDVVLLEGFSSASKKWRGIPKIVTAKQKSELARSLARSMPPILAISGRVAKNTTKVHSSRIPIVDVTKDGPILTSMMRRLLRPYEMGETLRRAAVKHGDACVGLAVGVRAAHLASSVFGLDGVSPKIIEFGAKQCIADGVNSIYPKSNIKVQKEKTDLIVFQSPIARLSLKLIPKHRARFTRARQVLNAPDHTIFESVELSN
jgi:molybdopterin-guanine dinucleotide biosynthesis protein MobB